MSIAVAPSSSTKVAVGRFAPSPTGPLHYGSLIAAVASYLNIRSADGIWLVRIEDLDPPREKAGAADDILRTLEKYGLYWDQEVTYQSQRSRTYDEALIQLSEKKLIYPCSCTRKEIAERGESLYPGHCRNGAQQKSQQYSSRVVAPDQIFEWKDLIQGEQSANLFQMNGDFIVRRADGIHAYHLAVVIDDASQGVTEIIRGADLLTSTTAQLFLQQMLNITTPAYGHVPIAVNDKGEKLSKQTGASPVSELDPGAILYRALKDLGQSPPVEHRRSSIDEILDWGIRNWDLNLVPAREQLK